MGPPVRRSLYIVLCTTALLRNCGLEIRPLGRADDAAGHAAEIVRRGLCTRSNRARTLARYVAKRAAERAETGPARLEGDPRDGQIGVAQHSRRALDAAREQVSVRRHTERLLERACEVRRGDAADTRKPPDGPVLVRGGVHSVLRAQEAAQQLGILIIGRLAQSSMLRVWHRNAGATAETIYRRACRR
jgi:hypothetical protein